MLKFEVPKKMMKIDQHPFSANMVDMSKEKNSLQAKVLTSQSAKESGAVDPKTQISADEVNEKRLQEKAECSTVPQRRVTSQMLLSKFQRDRERQQHREEETRRKEEHWKCPFFIHCWEEGLTLPSADDCPECNNLYRGGQSYKRPRFDDGPHRPLVTERYEHTLVYYRLGGKASVLDRLGGRVMLRDPSGGRIPAHDQLE